MALNLSFGKKGRKKGKKTPTNPLVALSSGAIIALIAVVLIIVFVIQPTVTAILNLNQEIEERQDLLGQLELKNQRLRQAQQLKNTSQSLLNRLNYSIPDEAFYTQDLKIIERIASDITDRQLQTSANTNFALLRISLSDVPNYQSVANMPRDGRAYKRTELNFTVSVKADYKGVQEFLEKVKANLRNFTITQITFSSPETKSTNILDVNIQIKSIYYSM